jgi:predicted nuclease of predicted toxin-antitoxin system
MRFLVDMNLSPHVANRLREQGHDAVHALDAGQGDLSDHEIFERAAAERRVVVTFDLDFGEIAGRANDRRTGVVLLRLKRAGRSYLEDRLRIAISEAGNALEEGAIVLVEDARIRVRRTGPEEKT